MLNSEILLSEWKYATTELLNALHMIDFTFCLLNLWQNLIHTQSPVAYIDQTLGCMLYRLP
jgi:hypothetical protein